MFVQKQCLGVHTMPTVLLKDERPFPISLNNRVEDFLFCKIDCEVLKRLLKRRRGKEQSRLYTSTPLNNRNEMVEVRITTRCQCGAT